MMKKSLKPLVTIGIPTFNRGSLIADTLQSAIEQDYPNIEIIISDNASSDQTENICTRLQQKYNNINYIRHDFNMGATNNFNFVLQQAKGEYFMWLGDDDWIDKNYITECSNMLIAHPDIALTAGIPKYYYGDTYLYTGLVMNIENNLPSQRVSDYFSLVQHNGIFYSVMRTRKIQKNSLKNVMGGDLLAIASMLFMGKAYTLETSCLHRRRGGCSLDGKVLAKSMQLPWLDQYFPRLSVAYNIFHHIAYNDNFSSLTKVQRYLLSVKCISLAFYRKVLTILLKDQFSEKAGIPDINNKH